jgi:hypothetical protein
MNLCEYKNILGETNTGIHSYRIFNIAFFDILLTLIGAYLISYIFKTSFLYTSIFLFVLGIILHRIFCVRTTIDKLLFP